MKVVKFGGSTLRGVDRIGEVVNQIRREREQGPVVVVLSALYGVTDELLTTGALAASDRKTAEAQFRKIVEHHKAVGKHWRAFEAVANLAKDLDQLAAEGQALLHRIATDGWTLPLQDAFAALGEKFSVRLLAGILNAQGTATRWWDADAGIIVTNDQFGHAEVDQQATQVRVQQFRSEWEHTIPLITGFIGQAPDGRTTTLGRDGSDYTAAILGSLLHATAVDIWTDVDGVLTADPEVVPDARLISQITYREAAEIAWFGARVLHPKTIHPLQEKDIPLFVKNIARPGDTGTRIFNGTLKGKPGIRTIVGKNNLAEIVIQFQGMLDHDHLLSRLFRVFKEVPHQIFLNDLGAPNHGVRLLVKQQAGNALMAKLEDEFQAELAARRLSLRRSEERVALVTLVGTDLLTRLQLPEQLNAILRREVRHARIFSFSNSETHVSLVVPQARFQPIMQRLHDRFFKHVTSIFVAIAGPTGNVGRELVRIIRQQAPALKQQYSMEFCVVAGINSRRMVINSAGVDPIGSLETSDASPADWERFQDALVKTSHSPLVFVDCTASTDIAASYAHLLENHIGVVAANKIANTREYAYYQRLKEISRAVRMPYLYSTTVGAGTPFIRIIKDIRQRGEEIQRLEGSLSGTLAFVFNRLNGGVPFSRAVAEAHQNGFTEPHPGVDLQGMDVARKLLILLREAGLRLELEDIVVESLVPEDLLAIEDPRAFLNALPQLDSAWQNKVERAHQANRRLIFLATFDGQQARVGVQEISAADYQRWPSGEGNQLRIYTDRFDPMPLTIEGPGAGPTFTAMGVYRDLVTAALSLLQISPEENGNAGGE